MTERAIHIGLLLGALAAAGWVFGGPGTAEPSAAPRPVAALHDERALLTLIPPGSAFVLTADIGALVHSPVGAFLGERLGRLANSGKLGKLCGFEPLERLRELVISVPSEGIEDDAHPADLGIVASGRFAAEEIARCAETVIRERGGDAVRTQLGQFRSVRDRQQSGGEVAARDGLLLVSGGAYLRALVDAASGNAEHREHQDPLDARHAELRARVGPGTVVATWLVGEHWLSRVVGAPTSSGASPLGAVKAVAARLDVDRSARLALVLDCAGADGAARVAELLRQWRSSLDGFGVPPVLVALASQVSIHPTSTRLELELELSELELQNLIRQLPALLGGGAGD